MANIKPFQCIRPNQEVVNRVAALPYDVYNRKEAKAVTEKEPLSFLNIDRPETQFEDSFDMYDEKVYDKAKDLLEEWIGNGTFMTEEKECYYVYELTMDGRAQAGIVACSSIDDYSNNVIKKHENTREEKEQDRIRHIDTCNAQTGPIFLAYHSDQRINEIVLKVKKEMPVYDFVAEDGIRHCIWKVAESGDIDGIKERFGGIDRIYIADGHHRAASAVKVGLRRREAAQNVSGKEDFNYFLSVLFPDDQLMILPYNRVVKDLNGHDVKTFIQKVAENFIVEEVGAEPFSPVEKGTFGMFVDGKWYKLSAKEEVKNTTDPVEALDVSILQNYLLNPVLGVNDPRTDNRIDFVGGIRGLGELERRVSDDMEVAFSMYPTSIQELFSVSDAGLLMPPKSTWFEPKLRSGIFIHKF